jgi:replication factor C subunit 3/5
MWVDKHRPLALDKLDFHDDVSKKLKKLVEVKDFPHMMFYGPSGAGKKTRIMAFLRENFGSSVEKLKIEHRTFKTPSNTNVELTMVASNHHVELNPSDAGIYDRLVVSEVIKELAQNQPLDSTTFKVVVLQEVDRMTREAQAGLRRTMEKYMNVCRLILCCNSTTKVIEPLRSRCLLVRVPAPTEAQICDVLRKVAKKEGILVPDDLAAQIAAMSDRNLRRALLTLEATKAKSYPFSPETKVDPTDWELFINQIAQEILAEQSPKSLMSIRAKFYELLAHCIPPEIIMRTLTVALLKQLDSSLKTQVVDAAAFYEHRLQGGSKPIYHLEAFVAKFMSVYRRWLLANFSGL